MIFAAEIAIAVSVDQLASSDLARSLALNVAALEAASVSFLGSLFALLLKYLSVNLEFITCSFLCLLSLNV